MGATNSTTNLQLPQFIGTDKPSWLGDFNGAMLKVDNFAGETESDIGTVTATANAAKATAEAADAAVGALETTVTQHTTEISDLMGDISSVEADIANINTLISQISSQIRYEFYRVDNSNNVFPGNSIICTKSTQTSYKPFSAYITAQGIFGHSFVGSRLFYMGYVKNDISPLIPRTTATSGSYATLLQVAVCVTNTTSGLSEMEIWACFDTATSTTMFFALTPTNISSFGVLTQVLTFYGITTSFELSATPYVGN